MNETVIEIDMQNDYGVLFRIFGTFLRKKLFVTKILMKQKKEGNIYNLKLSFTADMNNRESIVRLLKKIIGIDKITIK